MKSAYLLMVGRRRLLALLTFMGTERVYLSCRSVGDLLIELILVCVAVITTATVFYTVEVTYVNVLVI